MLSVYEDSYWGAPNSLVNWCEPDYVHSRYIAETWNSVSNLFTVFMGYMLYRHYTKNDVELRFRITALTLTIVGCGSFLFHGTLKYSFQLLDELPMLYLTCSMTYLTLETTTEALKYPKLPYISVVASLLFSIAHVYLQNAELFFLVFAMLLIPSFYFSVKYRHIEEFFTSTTSSLAFLAVGYMFWEADRHFCSKIQNLYLHAWWHVLTALSEIYWLNGMLYFRRKIIGEPVSLSLGGFWINFPKNKKIN
eukprot:NODE_709_length_4544_cov_1.024072.p3 type:complete len:250 gc:universal NODE_709_length_4544_cov_1.024072:1289-2038(+)